MNVILNKIGWVYAKGHAKGLLIGCQHCQRTDLILFPLPIDAIPFFTRAYQEVHRYCSVS